MNRKINSHVDYLRNHYKPNIEQRRFALELLEENFSFFNDLPGHDRVIKEKERYELVKDYIDWALNRRYDNLAAILVCWVNGMLECKEQAVMMYDLLCIPLQDRAKFSDRKSIVAFMNQTETKIFYWKDKGFPVYEKE